MVLTTPWTDEAVPAMGAIFSIASVPRFDEVKAKQRHRQPLHHDERPQALVASKCDGGMDGSDEHKGERGAYGRPVADRNCRRPGS